MSSIRHFRALEVYQLAMDASMKLFELSKQFPLEERYSLTDHLLSPSPRLPFCLYRLLILITDH